MAPPVAPPVVPPVVPNAVIPVVQSPPAAHLVVPRGVPQMQPVDFNLQYNKYQPPVPNIVPEPYNQAVQAVPAQANGENLLNVVPNNMNIPLLVPFSNELDICISQSVKEKIWGLEYIDLSILLKQNFHMPNENQNCIAVDNGRLIVQSVNKPIRLKQIDNISMWTDAFINYAKVLITRHPLLAGDLFMYMAIIRGATSDSVFNSVYMYDQQFRLRISMNPNMSWSQIDGSLWLRFIAKGVSGNNVNSTSTNYQKSCYDFNFKKGCFRKNCVYKHVCLKCNGSHPATLCNQFNKSNDKQPFKTTSQSSKFSIRPPLLGNAPSK